MSYQVIARKWRPQRFEDVVGQETITKTLRNALRSGRIAHAFLFSGVRGVGKTTTARILAKALNCHQGITVEPCGECPSCLEITEGNSVDVQEIDAASNRGIDNIRELRESARYGTARDRFKIFVVDEVHMLTNEAFNALLKTLEEPPSHVKFILATTEYHKLPVTITSRCQKYDFKPIAFTEILERLRLITESEGIEISEFALQAITSVAQGSMRDARSALDQVIAFSGKEVADEDVRTLLGVVDSEILSQIMSAITEQDSARLVAQLRELTSTGIEPQLVCQKLLQHLRNLMVFRIAGWDQGLLQLPDSEEAGIRESAERLSEVDLIRFYDVVSRTANELRWHSHPAIHLEISLLKLVELARLPRLEEVLEGLQRGGGFPNLKNDHARPTRLSESKRRESAATGRSPGQSSEELRPRRTPVSPTRGRSATDAEKRVPEQDFATSPQDVAETEPVENDREREVRELMDSLQERFMGLYQQLECASKMVYSDGKLRISYRANDAVHAKFVNAPDNFRNLSETFARIVGAEPQIDVVVERPSISEETKVDPTEDPKVKSFLKHFPGRVIVKREID